MTGLTCPVCGGDRLSPQGAYRATSELMSKRQKLRCDACTLVFAAPLPTEEEWTAYNAGYFESAHGTDHMAPRAVAFRSALGKIRAAFVERYAAGKGLRIDRVLEIGPGYGEFASAWKSLSPVEEYAALETDQSVHARLKELGLVVVPSLEEAKSRVPGYDLVVASHVLEHTLAPVEFLKGLAAATAPGGLIFIEVPCQDFLYKTADEPHTLFFDKESLRELCRQAGLGKPELTYHGEKRDVLMAQKDSSRIVRILLRLFARIKYQVTGKSNRTMLSQREWGVIQTFDAHIVQPDPARWVRLLVQKEL